MQMDDVTDASIPGDVLKSPLHFKRFEVHRVHEDGSISGRLMPGPGCVGSLCGLRYWRETWAKNATVIKRGD